MKSVRHSGAAARRVALLVLAVLALAPSAGAGSVGDGEAPAPVSFSKQIAPILLERCQGCHGPEKAKGEYRLDAFDRLTEPGGSGDRPIAAGKPDESNLYRLLVTPEEDDRMPKKGDPLSAEQVELIKRWIGEGAKFDGGKASASLASLAPSDHPPPPEAYAFAVPVAAVAFSPDGRELAAGGYHEVTIWDADSGKLLRRIRNVPQRVGSLAWSKDGKRLAVAGGAPGAGGEARLYDPASGEAGRVLDRISDMMLVVRFSPDGKRLAAGGADNLIRIYDAVSGRRQRLIEQHADWITDLAWSADGKRVASASRDKSCRIFDADTGAMESAYLDHEEPVTAVAWGDDGKTIFSVGKDRKLHAWNASDGKKIGQTPLGADPTRAMTAFGAVFICTADGKVRQFSQDKRAESKTFGPLDDWAYALAIDEKKHRIAAGAYDGEVRVWDASSGKQQTAFVAAPGWKRPER